MQFTQFIAAIVLGVAIIATAAPLAAEDISAANVVIKGKPVPAFSAVMLRCTTS